MSATGSFSLIDGKGNVLVQNALGTWGFQYTGGNTIAITPGDIGPPPDTFKPKKKLPTVGTSINVKILEAPKTVLAGDSAPLTIDISKPAKVSTVTSGSSKLADLNIELEDKGRGRIAWVAPLEPGRYKVRVTATSGSGAGRSSPVEIQVKNNPGEVEPGPPTEAAPPELDDAEEVSAPLVLSAGLLLLVVVCAASAVTMGWWRKQRSLKSR